MNNECIHFVLYIYLDLLNCNLERSLLWLLCIALWRNVSLFLDKQSWMFKVRLCDYCFWNHLNYIDYAKLRVAK